MAPQKLKSHMQQNFKMVRVTKFLSIGVNSKSIFIVNDGKIWIPKSLDPPICEFILRNASSESYVNFDK